MTLHLEVPNMTNCDKQGAGVKNPEISVMYFIDEPLEHILFNRDYSCRYVVIKRINFDYIFFLHKLNVIIGINVGTLENYVI